MRRISHLKRLFRNHQITLQTLWARKQTLRPLLLLLFSLLSLKTDMDFSDVTIYSGKYSGLRSKLLALPPAGQAGVVLFSFLFSFHSFK